MKTRIIDKMDMMNRNRILVLLVVLATGMATCKPRIEGELGEPFDKLAGINGTWQISTFSQRDENNPIKEVLDLSSFYVQAGVEATTISFNSSNMTYSIVPGPGKNYFGTGGTWHFDNNEAPSEITLESATDTTTLQMGTMPRTFDNYLGLELQRYCEDALGNRTATVTYIFEITRQ
ncbi:MAG: hypothetical protein ACKVOR_09720 [Flavobacteriales bacterium]